MSEEKPHVRLTESGYYHARWSANQWIQWPRGERPSKEHGFGWLTAEHFSAAHSAALELEQSR